VEFDKTIEDFSNRANEYNKIINEVIPYYTQMLIMIVDFIPFESEKEIKVLDLGCGIGNTADTIFSKYPKAEITAVDLAKKSLEICEQRFKNKNIQIIEADMRNEELYKKDEYDCIITNLAIHHIKNDDEKFKVYQNAYKSLNENGFLIVGENVHGSSQYLTSKYEDIWIQYMKDLGLNNSEIRQYYQEYLEKDHPTSMMNQLEFLKTIGYKEVDCIWKYSFFAIFCGKK
jgi:tRNA (cmo5U34)-methyltransferase